MEVVRLKFLKKWHWYKPGDTLVGTIDRLPYVNSRVVNRLIKDGIAERYISKKLKVETDALG
jgi:hypothetical protein